MAFLLIISLGLSSFFSPAWLTTRPEYFIVLTGLIIYLTKILKTVGIFKTELLLLTTLTVGAGISLIGQTLSGTVLVNQDLMILWRYLYYMALIVFGGIIATKIKPGFLLRLFIFLLATAIISVSFAQYYNILGINKIIVPLYTSSGAAESLLHDEFWRRVTGTYGNPNYWGFAMGIISATSFYFIYFKKKIIGVPYLLLSIISVIFTGSRAALISTIVSIFFSTIFILHQERKLKNIFLFMVAASVSVGLLYFIFTNFIQYENKGRFDSTNVATLDSRIEYWLQILESIQKSTVNILIGYGSSKGVSIQYGDNMYIRMLRDYGVIGLSTYIAFLFVLIKNIIFLSYKKITEARLLLYYIVIFLVFDLTADCWFEVRIICLLLTFYSYMKIRNIDVIHPFN
ncbi:O-antigen ligase family protein [Methylomonas sp. LL1]|uniref:O-antigen ligase family protein n=1 Tax=Methylomonas sp. LL1 TaxID=2785785 RepID=UPI0018C4353E|nr:O-antigen ligase family protein [Methylomonas sp. LL1]QPK62725.1 O-antigen ligase family protein [Methylomonas sp. LL1]